MTPESLYSIVVGTGLILLIAAYFTIRFRESQGSMMQYRYSKIVIVLADGMMIVGTTLGMCLVALGGLGLLLQYY